MQEVMEEGKEARDNHLGSIKMTIPTFQGKMILNCIWSWRERLNMCLIATIILRRKMLN